MESTELSVGDKVVRKVAYIGVGNWQTVKPKGAGPYTVTVVRERRPRSIQLDGGVQVFREDYFERVATPRPETTTPAPPVGQAGGLKFDGDKPRWSLLLDGKGMIRAILGVVSVLTFGAKKYAAHSWRDVEERERRYLDAMDRHLFHIRTEGLQAIDSETGLLHIDHVNCNGLFLAEFAREKKQ